MTTKPSILQADTNSRYEPVIDATARRRQLAAALRLAARARREHWMAADGITADWRAAQSAWERAGDHDVNAVRG
jgi:hypothetical protein